MGATFNERTEPVKGSVVECNGTAATEAADGAGARHREAEERATTTGAGRHWTAVY
jgi:hypothetical protein